MRWLAANISMLFTELPFLDRLAAARDHGFAAVECLFPYDFPPEVLARRAEAANVRFVLINAPPGDWDRGDRGLAALAGRERAFSDSIALASRYAAILGVKQVHVMAGRADPDDAAAGRRCLASFRLACDCLAEIGAGALVEPLNPFDMPGYFLADFDRAARFIADIGRANVALQFDLYHCRRIHGAVLPMLERLYPLVRHLQIAGTPLRHEPDLGDLPVGAIFDFLARVGYGGWIGCEYRPLGRTEDGLAWTAKYPQLPV